MFVHFKDSFKSMCVEISAAETPSVLLRGSFRSCNLDLSVNTLNGEMKGV